ncbi:uncharacterized protein A1O5_00848 [Cladophialophora psammophila CBS 110553]|uniref:BZIP domain-containing protein n=1 Tax=Cladophialophora psammophila CBS 110553 TaxID=1182543 RepID=W9XG92_9EURO|nr:uncharacterized protein A1O5_00848 [Cladophialophora psammophila CBS 110553]EXJ76340.1 hypothetical protein A1O5_00848 [Cladophialophora psammophila CBS 110553]
MQAIEQNIGLVLPSDFSTVAYGWSYPSSASSDQGPMEILDLFFDSAESSPVLHSSEPLKESNSQQSQSSNLYGNTFMDPSGVSFSVDYASSGQSDDFGTKDATAIDFTELPLQSNFTHTKMMDRKHRRREQNRKAQSNFRQKRKEELRRLEQEVEELRAQIARYHKQGPMAGLTICTRCRNFYSASTEAGDASIDDLRGLQLN